MAVERWAMIENGYVINICLWDGDTTKWKPPSNVEMQLAPDFIGIGWRRISEEWLPPEPIPQPEEIPPIEDTLPE